MVITKEQYSELLEILPDNAESLVAEQNVNALLEALHLEIVASFDDDDEPTERSDRVERLLDAIYWQNTH